MCHPDLKPVHISMLSLHSKRGGLDSRDRCPICLLGVQELQDRETLRDHVAEHLETIASSSLPLSTIAEQRNISRLAVMLWSAPMALMLLRLGAHTYLLEQPCLEALQAASFAGHMAFVQALCDADADMPVLDRMLEILQTVQSKKKLSAGLLQREDAEGRRKEEVKTKSQTKQHTGMDEEEQKRETGGTKAEGLLEQQSVGQQSEEGQSKEEQSEKEQLELEQLEKEQSQEEQSEEEQWEVEQSEEEQSEEEAEGETATEDMRTEQMVEQIPARLKNQQAEEAERKAKVRAKQAAARQRNAELERRLAAERRLQQEQHERQAYVPHVPPQPGHTQAVVIGGGRTFSGIVDSQPPPTAGYAQHPSTGRGRGHISAGGPSSSPQIANTQIWTAGRGRGNVPGAVPPKQLQHGASQLSSGQRQQLIATPEQRLSLNEGTWNDFLIDTRERGLSKH
jgi:hypothetical protein